jgi:hypothetical protein
MKTRYFANLTTRNGIIFAPHGTIKFNNHLAKIADEKDYEFLKAKKDFFELDPEKFEKDEFKLSNKSIFEREIQNYRLVEKKEAPKPEMREVPKAEEKKPEAKPANPFSTVKKIKK